MAGPAPQQQGPQQAAGALQATGDASAGQALTPCIPVRHVDGPSGCCNCHGPPCMLPQPFVQALTRCHCSGFSMLGHRLLNGGICRHELLPKLRPSLNSRDPLIVVFVLGAESIVSYTEEDTVVRG